MILRLMIAFILSLNIANAEELKTITSEEFLNQSPSPERKALINFIIHQFDGKSVTKDQLDKLWNNKEVKHKQHLIRFQIVNQKLYADSFEVGNLYFIRLWEYFSKFVQKYKVNDVDFIIYARDETLHNHGLNQELVNVPAFMMSKNLDAEYEKNKFLLPDAHMLMNSWAELTEKIKETNIKNLWQTKIDKIFWRGASTGSAAKHFYNIYNFDKFARLKLTMFSKLYPDLVDAKLNRYPDFSEDDDGKNLKKILQILFGKDKEWIKEEDHLKYKYLIALDGNTCPWVRVPWIMLSNSVLLKQETNKIEWFYPALKPYINYVPVKEDLTDIFEKIQWMKDNDRELQQISTNAQNFVKNNLMPEHIDAHMAIILNEYHKIQKDGVIIASLTEAEDVLSMPALLKSLIYQLSNKVTRWFQ